MMKISKPLLTLSFMMIYLTSFAQEQYEPTILILSPNETSYDQAFKKELQQYNKRLMEDQKARTQSYITSEEFLEQPANIQETVKSEIAYAKNTDFFKSVSTLSHQFLVYRFFEKFSNLLIKLKDETSNGRLDQLSDLANQEGLQYVLNFPEIKLYRQDKVSYAEIKIQLYDQTTNSLLLDKRYKGDWSNPGFEFSCVDESIDCTISNALSMALNEIIYTIAANSPTIQRERQLKEQRLMVLAEGFLEMDYDDDLVRSVVSDSTIDTDHIYQVLYNDDQTKFVAFSFVESVSKDLKSLTEEGKDQNVKIISSGSMSDGKVLGEIPGNYAFVIAGLQYQGKWYYEKLYPTYLKASSLKEGQQKYFNSLQGWNFFQENSTVMNPDFWETALFAKVKDLRLDPEWDKYGDSIWQTKEANNRKYIGLYEIVAKRFKARDQKEREVYERLLLETIIRPTFDKLSKMNPKQYAKYSRGDFIHSKNLEITLNPVAITDASGVETMHYNVVFKNSKVVYKWRYFPDELIKGRNGYTDIVIANMEKLTSWNFLFNELDDPDFWNNYVTAQKDGKYLYLELITE